MGKHAFLAGKNSRKNKLMVVLLMRVSYPKYMLVQYIPARGRPPAKCATLNRKVKWWARGTSKGDACSQKGNQIRHACELAFLGSKIGNPEHNSIPTHVIFSGMDCGLFRLSNCTFFVFIFAFLSGARFATTPKTTCIYYISTPISRGCVGRTPTDTGIGIWGGG